MHKPNAPIKRLVHDRPVHARDQILEEGDGGCAPLRRVRRVVDVVGRDVGQVGGRGVLEGVELVDEVEEDGVLLAGGGGLGGAEWCLRCAGVIVRCWGSEEDGESGESEGEEGGEMHGSVDGVDGGRGVGNELFKDCWNVGNCDRRIEGGVEGKEDEMSFRAGTGLYM